MGPAEMPEDNSEQRFRGMFDWTRFPVGDQKELVYSPLTESTHILPSGKVQILRGCKTMETLDTHASRLCQEYNVAANQITSVRQQLIDLVEAGLLVSYESLTARITDHAVAEDVPPKIASIGFPTKNRPQALKRCLESYAECAKTFDRDDLVFQIVDQSDELDSKQANLQVLASVKAQFGIKSQYLDRSDVENFARLLLSSGDLPPDVVNFAILNIEKVPLTLGLSRNLIELLTIGDLNLQVDDDTICRIKPCSETSQGPALTSEYDPTEFWFISESETASLGDGFATENFFAIHEQLLGKSVASCIEEPSGVLNFDQINSSFFRRLSPGRDRVAVTSIGVAGEAGMDGSSYLLTLDGKSRSRLMRSESDYRHSISSHQVLRSVTTPTISSGSLVSGHNQGYDNRHFLPPHFPVLRGELVPFGNLFALSPSCGGYIGFLPWHLLHKPIVTRSYSSEYLCTRASSLFTCAIFEALIQSFNLGRERSPEKSLDALGKSFVEWGSAPLADFEEMLTLLLSRRASMQILKMEGELKQYAGIPAYWQADVHMCVTGLREALAEKRYIVGRDLIEVFGLDQARIVQQRLVRRFGELLQSWSAIREVARDLRARGLH
ncbi:hypothetical protein BH10CYA1_BH10CYA1_51710 [soil metagenome]